MVKVEKQHTEDVKRLLTLMGVPFITAPCEAEAQCAELVKKGKCYGVGTEDMDALTFGTHVSYMIPNIYWIPVSYSISCGVIAFAEMLTYHCSSYLKGFNMIKYMCF